jgi:hypothetical protein
MSYDLRQNLDHRGIEVYNPHPYPIVVNTIGQVVGGRKTARVDVGDPIAMKMLSLQKLMISPQVPKKKKSTQSS